MKTQKDASEDQRRYPLKKISSHRRSEVQEIGRGEKGMTEEEDSCIQFIHDPNTIDI